MTPKEELMSANADVMTIIAHVKKIGWGSIGIQVNTTAGEM